MSAVCGVRGWALVLACFWDVCGFVGAPLAPRRFRFRRAVWACVLGLGLACAQPFLAGLSGCVFFFCFVVPVPPSPFFRAGLVALCFFFFLFSVSLFPVVRCYWLGVAGFGWVVPLCLCGGPFFFFLFFFRCLLGGGLAACGSVGGLFGGCGLFSCLFPFPPPFFFWGGGGLPVPPSACPGLAHALACIQCCLPGCCLQLRSVWSRSGPMGRVGFVHVGSAPFLAGLGPGSAGWAAAPGGCLWFWVRGLGLFVSLPLCGAGCNLLGGPSPLSPGALWPRVWLAVLVCGVVARRLPGCAVAGFG